MREKDLIYSYFYSMCIEGYSRLFEHFLMPLKTMYDVRAILRYLKIIVSSHILPKYVYISITINIYGLIV